MSSIDYLFVFPKSLHGFSTGNTFDGFDYHLGAAYIRAFLETQGVRTEQFLHPGNATLGEIADSILACYPRAIAFSCYDSNYYTIKVLAEKIRQRSSCIPIICGGPTATFSDFVIMGDCSAIDLCVRSYGEIAALQILHWLTGERRLESIPGVTYRDRNNVLRTPERTAGQMFAGSGIAGKGRQSGDRSGTLDMFPDPYVAGLIPPPRAHDIGILTSRGCTYPCTFCSCSAMSGRKVSLHSDDRVLSVLGYLDRELAAESRQRTTVAINDDNFSLRPGFHGLLRRIDEASYRHLEFWAEMRTEALREESFRLLKRARFTKIHFGLESAVPHVLAKLKKVRARGWQEDNYAKEQAFVDRLAWAVKQAKDAGIETGTSIILGCPGETEEDGRATLDFVKQLSVDRYAHNYLVVQAGTELARSHREFGIQVNAPLGRALPRHTCLTYDVCRLPVLSQDRLRLSTNGTEMLHALRLLTGSMNAHHRVASCPPDDTLPVAKHFSRTNLTMESPEVFGMCSESLTDTVLDWLEQDLKMNASLWILHHTDAGPHTFEGRLSTRGVPIQQVNTLRGVLDKSGSRHWRVNELSTDAPFENTRTITTLSFASVDWSRPPASHWGARHTLLLSIRTKADVDAMMKVVDDGILAGTWHFRPWHFAARVALEDGCRWCSSKCPASTGGRWFVDSEGRVRTCLNGEPVGHAGDPVESMRDRVRELWQVEIMRRGCKTCSVVKTCSQCLFPGPLGQQSFCEAMCRRPEVVAVADGLVLARVLQHTDGTERSPTAYTVQAQPGSSIGSLHRDGEEIALSECLLLSLDGDTDAFVYHARSDILARVAGRERKVIEALLSP